MTTEQAQRFVIENLSDEIGRLKQENQTLRYQLHREHTRQELSQEINPDDLPEPDITIGE